MTDEQLAILTLVREKNHITIESNREYYESIEFNDAKWIMTSGDPMSGEEKKK